MYLGFDIGTQSVKAVLVNAALEKLEEATVHFDKELAEFRTSGGVNRDVRNPKVVTAQPLMWIKALDLVLEKLRFAGVLFEQVLGISGAGQQHGSVYWKRGARQMLQNPDPRNFLYEELAFAFSMTNSPIWMDSSTTPFCTALEEKIGGPEKLSLLTGSRAYERFTGSQISKIFHTKREVYNVTERISLVSSFACSIFLGDYANIDYADASGMNLLDIRKKCWSEECLAAITDATANLADKLGSPVPAATVQGNISPYFVERFGFSPDCKVLTFTGDNPSSFAGMCLRSNDIALSLGTSDTLFLSLKQLPPEGFVEGHILVSPLCGEEFMALLCFKNASLTRERLKRTEAQDSWAVFNERLRATPPGNFGNMGFYFDLQEILPKATPGEHRFNKERTRLLTFPAAEIEIRALIEGQFLSKRVYAQKIGWKVGKDVRILATGGASSNHSILQVLSDVFNAPVFVQESKNSADLGACYRLKHALAPDAALTFAEVVGEKHGFHLACEPIPDAADIYDQMAQDYVLLEKEILTHTN